MPLLDIDPLTGAVETFKYDHDTKQSIITRTRSIDATLDRNTWAFNNSDKTWKGKDLWHVASVPEDLVWTWLLEFNAVRPVDERIRSPFTRNKDWEDFQWKRLNSSGYHKLRVAPVHV
jgi:hypothetical protein